MNRRSLPSWSTLHEYAKLLCLLSYSSGYPRSEELPKHACTVLKITLKQPHSCGLSQRRPCRTSAAALSRSSHHSRLKCLNILSYSTPQYLYTMAISLTASPPYPYTAPMQLAAHRNIPHHPVHSPAALQPCPQASQSICH